MKTIEAIATISSNGTVQLINCENVPIGKFRVVLVIDESPLSQKNDDVVEDSFLAATADLVGSLEGLPPDLSVNKDYLNNPQEQPETLNQYPNPSFYGCIQDDTFFRHDQGTQADREVIV